METFSPSPTDETLLFPFRRYKVFSRQFARYIGIIVLSMLFGALSTASTENLHKPRFLTFMAVYLGIILAIFVGRRIYMEKKGGVSPIAFEKDAMVLPLHAHSARTRRIPYEDMLSVTVRGKKLRVLILDTKQRTFAYAVREFAEPDAADKILSLVGQRIESAPGGAALRAAMEIRHAKASQLRAVKPMVTWALLAIICVIFAGQCLFAKDDNLFDLLDLGANAGILSLNGEWFRLVTANLLHANFMHIFNNALFILIVGTMTERLLGARRLVLLVLATGIASQLVSALWHRFASPSVLFSVGISGVLFGILGALAVINLRFKNELPGGFRLAKRFWWTVLGINLIATPLAFPEVDTACHIGGLLSGLLIGWLLCRSQATLMERPRFGALPATLLAGLGILWCAGLLTEAQLLFNPAVREANHAAFVQAILTAPANPQIDNALAWSIAVEPAPTKEQLDDALTLSTRAVNGGDASGRMRKHDRFANIDTMATVYYRMGNLDAAIDNELGLLDYPDPNFPSQLARFLNAYRQAHGTRLIDASSTFVPTLSLNAPDAAGKWTFNLSLPEALPDGARLYALLMQEGKIVGLVRISVPPNAQSWHYTNWTIEPPPTLKSGPEDPAPELVLAQYDKRDCDCLESDGPRAWYYAYEKEIATLP